MPSDFYDSGDSEDDASSPSTAESDESSDSKSNAKDDDSNTALLPKSFFKNKDKLEVGDVEKIEIVHLYSDEAEVKCIYKKKDKDDSESKDGDSKDMKDSMDQLDESYA